MSLVQQHSTLITPNQRLAAYFRQKYDQVQHMQGVTVWPSFDILPLNAWLERSYHFLTLQQPNRPYLLNGHQSKSLWTKAFNQVRHSSTEILNITGLMNEIQEAWELIHSWNLNLNSIDFSCSQDGLFFKKIAEHYQSLLNDHHWLDAAQLPDHLIHSCALLKPYLPIHFILQDLMISNHRLGYCMKPYKTMELQ